LVMVLPNRRGMWARFDHTPFGNGTPYTKAQLSQVLGDAGFSINSWGNALFHSPSQRSSRRIFIPSFQPQGVGAREASHRSKTS